MRILRERDENPTQQEPRRGDPGPTFPLSPTNAMSSHEPQIQLEIDPLLSEPYVVYLFGQLNARQEARHFPTPEALLSCLKAQFGVDAHTAEHAVTDLRKRGRAQIHRAR
jgi:hypothetical protein